jgi:uncharacterized membrane protein YkvA (DUF1232 family)
MKISQPIELNSILSFVKRFRHLLGEALEPVMIIVVMVEKGAVPFWAWPVIAAAVAYLLNPIDGMPDPVFLDDAAVLAGAISLLQSAISDEIRIEARKRTLIILEKMNLR